MKKKAFFLAIILLLSISMLVACTATELSFSTKELVIAEGDKVAAPIIIKPQKAKYELTSADESIVKVEGGYILGIAAGETTITVTSAELTATIAVKVIPGYSSVQTKVTYRVDDERIPFSEEKTVNFYSVIAQADTPSLNEIIPDGYNFDGWYLEPTFESKGVFPYNLGTTPITFYGRWLVRDGTDGKGIDVNFELEGVGASGVAVVTGFTYPTVTYNTIELPTVYIADGWQYPVKKIKANAFRDRTDLVSVAMPSIQEIGAGAFQNCSNLSSVSVTAFEEGLNTLGDACFAGTALEEWHFNAQAASFSDLHLTSFGTNVFQNTPFFRAKTTQGVFSLVGENPVRNYYRGFAFAGYYLGYDEATLSNYDDKITVNVPINEVRVDFSGKDNIFIYLKNLSAANAANARAAFLAAGVQAGNIIVE